MEDLAIKLNPITKLEIYTECKNIIFAKMNNDIITPEKADEILSFVKENVVKISNPKQAKEFYVYIANKFIELQEIKVKFNIEEDEKISDLIILIVDEFMEEWNIDLAWEIMEEIKKINNNEITLNKLETKYPIQFKKAFKKLNL